MPALASWLARFALPSVLSIVGYLRRAALHTASAIACAHSRRTPTPQLTRAGRWAAFGIALSAAVLLTASAFDVKLGWPTFLVAAVTSGAVLLEARESAWRLLKTSLLECAAARGWTLRVGPKG